MRLNHWLTSFFTLAATLLLFAAPAAAQQADATSEQAKVQEVFVQNVAATPSSGFNERYPRYRIQSGDTLTLNFTLSQEFNQEVSVQPDGFVTLRDAGDIHIAGLTTAEAGQAVAKAYNGILREPMVSVVLKDFEKPFFVAGGEFKQPGRYDLRGSISVMQAVAMAGGFTESAKHSEVYLFRRISQEEVTVKKLNVKKMIASSNLSEDMFLKPGDVLWVPQNLFSKLKGFLLPRGMLGPVNPLPRN